MFSHEQLDDDRIEAALADRPRIELRMELACALESLPPLYLEMILLRDFEELTITEICERLGMTVATAKSRLRRARILVREYLLGADSATSDGMRSARE
jgi:RNA polymerase sigma factor (sigma-70 family)